MEDSKYDTLVLSGGGTNGFYILGALQCLTDNRLLSHINIYVGTSIGAILSYLLAIGYTPTEIVVSLHTNKWLEKMQHFNLVAMINGNGAASFSPIHEALETMTLSKIGCLLTLDKLKERYGKTLFCTTYNMTTCNVEFLGPDNYADLPCLTALRMSANIPMVFDRFKYMDNFYVDGGIADNFPIVKGSEVGKKVLGIYLDIPLKSLQDEPEDGILTYFIRLMQIPMTHASKYRINLAKDKCTIIKLQTPTMQNVIQFDIKSKIRLDMFSHGYTQGKEFIEKEKILII